MLDSLFIVLEIYDVIRNIMYGLSDYLWTVQKLFKNYLTSFLGKSFTVKCDILRWRL